MNPIRHRTVLVALVASISFSGLSLRADDVPWGDACRLLTSPIVAEQKQGTMILKEREEELLQSAMNALAQDDYRKVAEAARAIRILVSPWQRGVERSSIHHGQIELGKPSRQVDRPVDHAASRRLALALIVALEGLIEKNQKLGRIDEPGQFLAQRDSADEVCRALAEVIGQDNMERLARTLSDTEDRLLCGAILGVFETFYALPKGYRIGLTCGNSTAAELREFEHGDSIRCKEAKVQILEWHEKTKGLPVEGRLAAALKKWDEKLEQQGFRYRGYYGGGWDWRKLEPLIRAGKPVVPLINARVDAVDDLGIIGNYEVVLATIRGKPNEVVIRKLLSSENPSYRHHYAFQACEIIVASGSTDWMDELNKLQYRKYFKQRRASHALAICHRKSAIPFLKQAMETNPSNSTAKYAILELETWAE